MKAPTSSATKIYQIIQLILFGLFMSMPVLSRISGLAPEAQTSENRPLAVPPTWDEGWMNFSEDFSDYFRDHFGFRYELIHLHNLLAYRIFNQSSADTVIIGKEGWLFYNSVARKDGDTIADARNALPLTEIELKKAVAYIRYCQAEAQQRDIPYLFVVAPNKSTIYRDYLPEGYMEMKKTSPLDQLLVALSRPGDPYILDLRPALRKASAMDLTYRKTDTHWNQWGALQGYLAIQATLSLSFPELATPDLTEFKREAVWINKGGGLAKMLGLQSDFKELRMNVKPILTRPPYRSEIETRIPRNTLRTSADLPESPRVLFFHDSFTTNMIPFFSSSFREVTYYWSPTIHQNVIDEMKPDLILHVMIERQLRNLSHFFDYLPKAQKEKWYPTPST
ncbi:hypothetical protein P3T73_06745 [Kiritimatiellota bacterium B12222]|nr:hypothetical protein P3T73_06745 [Kiritimatiellota bacterium B12222]